MLRKRTIPIVLLDGFSVLKTIQFAARRNLGSPITVARTYNTRNVDELILLDIDASTQRRAIDKFTIAEISKDCFMPLTVGGGIASLKDIELLLQNGADKIAINTQALQNPKFIADAANTFGSQCVTVSIDVVENNSGYGIYNRSVTVEKPVIEWVQEVEGLGAGEILINNVTRDGTMTGADIQLAGLIARAVNIPVIYAGGVKDPMDVAQVALTNISGVGVSSIFHFTNATPEDCRVAMKKLTIPVR